MKKQRVPRTNKKRVPVIVAAVVQPVAKRLARLEAILNEMRFEQEIQTKRITALREQFDHFVKDAAKRPGRAKGLDGISLEPSV